MNIDFVYGVVSLILGFLMLLFVIRLRRRLNKNPTLFLSSFYIKKHKRYAFVFFFITNLVLAINYGITTFISLNDSMTLVWEYGNIILFTALTLFFLIMSLS
ncbi:MAG: hypothetical protein BJBARM4_0059 [Candidatus Parvarchaeum acidiphilum ARMAN-4]|jgi:hypothetical protein|uniref:Uncharacterized protein n=1 Tax=Candidatus Parvarchaeum acidiphilum ARMAN-4 TaxID=662760 RepID=D2EEC2_PARA4|nr:MAG: hypothetical protein BJBARM4_0059 [Candidatus Parvarchaeum acidiphilum ARMAN-4]